RRPPSIENRRVSEQEKDKEKAQPPVPTVMKPQSGPFSLRLYQRTLERIQETGAVLTLSVSSGMDERIFFFTRGAILFLATGTSGGHLLERKILARGLLPKEKLLE